MCLQICIPCIRIRLSLLSIVIVIVIMIEHYCLLPRCYALHIVFAQLLSHRYQPERVTGSRTTMIRWNNIQRTNWKYSLFISFHHTVYPANFAIFMVLLFLYACSTWGKRRIFSYTHVEGEMWRKSMSRSRMIQRWIHEINSIDENFVYKRTTSTFIERINFK